MSDEDRKLLQDVHACLIGDKLKGKPGLVDVVDLHRKDIYGDPETGHEGMKPQLKNLIDGNRAFKWWWGGIVSVASATFFIAMNWSWIKSLFK